MKVRDLVKLNDGYKPKIIIFGPFRSGKTSFVGQAGEEGLLIDFDRGWASLNSSYVSDKWSESRTEIEIESFFEGDFQNPTSYTKAKSFLIRLVNSYRRPSEGLPKVVIVDSLTGLAKSITYTVLASSGHQGKNPTMPEWGLILNELENFINLLRSLPAITIVTAHEFAQIDDSGSTRIKVLCPGRKLPNQICGFFDDVFYARIKKEAGGKLTYNLTSEATPSIECGTRTSFKEDYNMNDGFYNWLKKLGYVVKTEDDKTNETNETK